MTNKEFYNHKIEKDAVICGDRKQEETRRKYEEVGNTSDSRST
jgi:hypothetical protein